MAYETKVILIALARIAAEAGEKKSYAAIAQMANAEGVVLKSYEEAKAELDGNNAKVTSSKAISGLV